MESKAKSLQLLGAFGIVGESFKIVHFQARLLGTITLLFITLVHSLIALLLLAKIIVSKEINEERKLPTMQFTELLVLEIVYTVFSYAALMPSMAAVVVYTVASVYMGNHNSSFAGMIKLDPAVWKRMMVTCLWYFVTGFVNFMAFAFAVCLLALVFLELGKSPAMQFYVTLSVVCVVLFVYVRMVWQVATVVCVMEEEYYGLEGMKIHRLMEGKHATAWVLTISYLGINGLFGYAAIKGNVHRVGLGPKIAFAIACVGMACAVAFMGALTHSVVYFVCKSHHGKSIDGYLDECQAVNNKDIESLEP